MSLRVLALAFVASLAWCQALEQAKRAFDKGDYAAAARLFEQAHQATPSCETLFFLGLARYRLKQPDAALIAFRSAVECDPKLLPAHLALAEAYTERHNDTEALSAYNRVLGLDPKNANALSGAANIYLKAKSNQKAVELLETLAPVAPFDSDAHADLAAAYAASGDRARAEEQFQIALKIRPAHASALMGLGNLCLKNGEEDRAIELLQKAVQAAMKAFEPRFLLGSAYNRVGRYQDALDQLQYAVKLGANEPEVYYHLARAYGGLGRQEERAQALARFAQITKKSKEDVEGQRRALGLMEEAKSLVDAGNLHLAAARMEEARELRPSDDRLLFRLASLQYDLKRYDLAHGYAQEAIALAPSEWLYHYLAGLIAKGAGKWRQARNSLETAARLNASAAEVQNALGEVAVHEGNFQGAIAAFERAVQLNPDERAYRLNLEAARRPNSKR
jgi:tetratricopeptide (TPR) repeat protein